MGVRQKTYKGKTQKQNSKGWRRWAEQHTQTHQTEWESESVSSDYLPPATTTASSKNRQKSELDAKITKLQLHGDPEVRKRRKIIGKRLDTIE
jgi:hypothetical protein